MRENFSEIIIKTASNDISGGLVSINFDSAYIDYAKLKYSGRAFKIFGLKPYEANILKQTCLSLGFDCAVSRDAVRCACDTTDALVFASCAQYKKLIAKLLLQPFRLKQLALKLEDIIFSQISPLVLKCGKTFYGNKTYIAGILNVTPDSFSCGGKYFAPQNALQHALSMIENGADIIDIGGESTRPGAEQITPEEEMKRIIPVVKLIKKNAPDMPLSIDTRNYETAKAAIDEGADIINDVSGLEHDLKLFDFTAENNIPCIIMHSDKIPASSVNFTNKNIIDEIYISFDKKIKKLINAGMTRNNIIIDPGIGFGKTAAANFEIMRRLNEFKSLKTMLMLGISRKSFLQKTFNLNACDADLPSAFFSAALKDVNISRVHNVKLARQFLDYAEKLK